MAVRGNRVFLFLHRYALFSLCNLASKASNFPEPEAQKQKALVESVCMQVNGQFQQGVRDPTTNSVAEIARANLSKLTLSLTQKAGSDKGTTAASID